MDPSLLRSLADKTYDKRKTSALEVERLVRDSATDLPKLDTIISQLCELSKNPSSNGRSGGIMGLAAASIALGSKIGLYLGGIVPPILACFNDADSKVRYFACESMYNVAKVAKGEILIFFNELFDAMSKLAADTELPVKNGAELLDRLIKDIVTEQASTYVSLTNLSDPKTLSTLEVDSEWKPEKAFSLARFIPLLSERIYVLNPFTRNYLVSWLTVLDSVPELELISFLPEFLDGLLKFLGDPTVDIRTATQNVLADFLREIRQVAEVGNGNGRSVSRASVLRSVVDDTVDSENEGEVYEEAEGVADEEGSGEWIPGQGVKVDHSAIIEILLQHSSFPDEEIQSTCLRWLAEFLLFVQPTMVPFTSRLIPVILSSLAHHVIPIRTAANETNYNLYKVVQELSIPIPPQLPNIITKKMDVPMSSPGLGSAGSRTEGRFPDLNARDRTILLPSSTAASSHPMIFSSSSQQSIPKAPTSPSVSNVAADSPEVEDDFDYGATVNALTLQFLNEHEETRVAALEWLLMLHQKAPKKVLAVDDLYGSESRNRSNGPTESGLSIALLLKMLSDSSEKVLRYDLRLIAQISSNSEDEQFPNFIANLLSLFSTDRKLLETRGGLIIRQLCVSLNTERIYRSFAEILERDEDLEFASIMVQNLNLIMITSPELSAFRKRLKTLESKDGQNLFVILYKSWSHNAVATFSLCLLAQAYEQACSLLQIFADLEITVSLLIQIDKLVQLLESPVFTSLRLQLLEPEKHPFLLKAMYGLLMLLPQSSAFATLRNRLSAVNSLGFLQLATTKPSHTTTTSSSRPTVGGMLRRDEIKWTELANHFKGLQMKHERIRKNLNPMEGSASNSNSGVSVFTGSRNVSAATTSLRTQSRLGKKT